MIKLFMENRKKGQAEIFGLIIIMMLLIFALLFFIKTRQDDTSTVTIRSNFKANNLLNAIVNLDYVDKGTNVNMKSMLKKCKDDPSKCEDVKGNLTEIFEKSLSNENYEFRDDNGVLVSKGNCENGIAASPVRLPGDYVFELKLCYG